MNGYLTPYLSLPSIFPKNILRSHNLGTKSLKEKVFCVVLRAHIQGRTRRCFGDGDLHLVVFFKPCTPLHFGPYWT